MGLEQLLWYILYRTVSEIPLREQDRFLGSRIKMTSWYFWKYYDHACYHHTVCRHASDFQEYFLKWSSGKLKMNYRKVIGCEETHNLLKPQIIFESRLFPKELEWDWREILIIKIAAMSMIQFIEAVDHRLCALFSLNLTSSYYYYNYLQWILHSDPPYRFGLTPGG